MYSRRDSDGFPWNAGGDGELTSFSRSTGGLSPVQADIDNSLLSRENSHQFNCSAVPASSMTKPQQENRQRFTDSNQLDYTKQAKISMKNEENDNLGVKHYQMGNISNVTQNSYRAAETYEQHQNSYLRDNSYDSYNPEGSKSLKHGHLGQFKFTGDVSNNSIILNKVNNSFRFSLRHLW